MKPSHCRVSCLVILFRYLFSKIFIYINRLRPGVETSRPGILAKTHVTRWSGFEAISCRVDKSTRYPGRAHVTSGPSCLKRGSGQKTEIIDSIDWIKIRKLNVTSALSANSSWYNQTFRTLRKRQTRTMLLPDIFPNLFRKRFGNKHVWFDVCGVCRKISTKHLMHWTIEK